MIPKKTTKMIVKDGSGNLVQLLPEIEAASTIDASSNVPVSNAALASALEDIEDSLPGASALLDVMEEEPTALNTTELDDEALIVQLPSSAWLNAWSITVDTKANGSDNKKTGIPFNLYGQDGITLTVDWGDGSTSTLTSADYTESDSTASVHEYAKAGMYNIKINSSNWENTYLLGYSTDFRSWSSNPYTNSTVSLYWFRKTLICINKPFKKIKGMKVINYDNGIIETHDNSFAYGLFGCAFLQSLLPNLFENNILITDFSNCFNECKSLQSIPEKLFENNTAAVNFEGCFDSCTSLHDVPANLFASNVNAVNFNSCFGASDLRHVPSTLFASNIAAESFSYCFSCNYYLRHIPANLFANNINVVDMSGCFETCEMLAEIPSGLFDSLTEVTTFNECFEGCINVPSIPSGLFDNNTKVTDFGWCFNYCYAIESIPSGLFDNNTLAASFEGCFTECTSITSIPSGLFDNNTAVTTFDYCFGECSSLVSIPVGLFDNNINVTNFGGCFASCSSLQSIPSNIFANNIKVTTFTRGTWSGCFEYCTSLNDFTLHIGSPLVEDCSKFVVKKDNTSRIVYVPSGSTTQTTFNAAASSLGLTIIGE